MARRDIQGFVDFGHLEAYLQNDAAIIDEVLGLFQQQADIWEPMLDPSQPGWRDAAHTLKGAAAGIGADEVRDRAEAVEKGEAEGADLRIAARIDAIARALMDVAAYRHEWQIKSLRG